MVFIEEQTIGNFEINYLQDWYIKEYLEGFI